MSSGTHKDAAGHYFYEKKKKRDTLSGNVTASGTPVILQGNHYTTGPFIAETLWACNGDTACGWFQILDGAIPRTCRVLLAPGTLCQVTVNSTKAPNFLNLSPIWIPFFTSVRLDASSANVIVTLGGWIP